MNANPCAAPAAALLLGLLAALPAHGYDFLPDPPAGRFAMNLSLGSTTAYTIGYGATTWKEVAQKALEAWNQVGVGPQQDHHFFSVQTPTAYANACAQDGVNQVSFSTTMCGLGFGSALAVTRSWSSNGQRVEDDVIFDSNRSWNAYFGPAQTFRPDFYRVALHEFGHIVGLDHPDEVGQTKQALMNSAIGNLDTLQDDDIQGAHLVNWHWFNFPTRYGVAPNSTIASNAITVNGVAGSAAIGVSGGEYSIDGGGYTRAAGTVGNGQTVTLLVAASGNAMTATTATLSIGTAQGDFTAITAQGAAPITASASGYIVLADGTAKTFRKDGAETEIATVQPGTTMINGVATKALLSSDGSIAYVTNDSLGLREHRGYDPATYFKGYGYAAVTTTLSPPAVHMPAQATMGQTVNSTGTANLSIPQLGIDAYLTYRTESTPEGFETISVPAGTFNTIRVASTLSVSGSVAGEPLEYTIRSVEWVASGIGHVKSITTSGSIATEMLTASNLLPVANIALGWNLVGNGTDAPLNVATALGDASQISSVWKWLPGANQWAFYSPSLSAQALSDYAAAKGYGVLSTINPGEGYWVNAKLPFTARLPAGNAVAAASFRNALVTGWNLLAIGETKTPAQFNVAIGTAPASPIPNNLTTLWSWEPVGAAWYFYAPSLEADGSLASYIASKGYRDFAAAGKTLGPDVGFWVHKP